MDTKGRRKKFSTDDLGGEASGKLEGAGAASKGEVAQPFDLGEVKRKRMGLAEAAEDAALQGYGLRLEERQLDAVGLAAALARAALCQQRRDKLVETGIFGRGDFRGLAESLAELRIVVALQGGQELGAQAIAEKAWIEIGVILAKALAEREQELLDLLAADGEKRTDEARGCRSGRAHGAPHIRQRRADVGRRRDIGGERIGDERRVNQRREVAGTVDSGEAAGTGAAEQAKQDGFRLIVAGMRGGHAVKSMGAGGAQKECVAGTASGGFEREMFAGGERGDIGGFDDGFQ